MSWRNGFKQKNVSPQREKDEQYSNACSSSQPTSRWRTHVDAGAQTKWGGYYFYFEEMERLECWPKLNGKTL